MNASRRKKLEKIIESVSEYRLELETLRDEEQECFDNMPEGLQGSEKGQAIEESASNLDEAVTYLESVEEYINEAIS